MLEHDFPKLAETSGQWPAIKENRPLIYHWDDGHGSEAFVAGVSASDAFLGWTTGKEGRHFYVHQLRDMKLAPLVEAFNRSVMLQYAEVGGWTLARAHARSGEPAAISGYLGQSDSFDTAIAKWSSAYADQNERDHGVLMRAAHEGRLEVAAEPE